MKEIKTLNPDAHQYLMEKDPKTWSRDFFQTGRCCDAVENGFSESFNAVIVDARKKPIITMLEELRLYMMDIIYNKKLKGQQWGNHICPEISDNMNLLKKAQRHYQVLPSGLNQFEVRGGIDAYEVDLERLWQLNGYGCAHSVASTFFLNRDVEAYVYNMFSTTTFRKAYNYIIAPMNNSDMWPETNYTPPLPPISRRMPGRPATKRKKSTTENQEHTRSYEGDESVVGEEADVVVEAVVVEEVVQDEEAEEVDPVIHVDNVNVQEVDEVNPNSQVDNVNVQKVAPIIQVQQVKVRLI
ncbi:unnamed protein product [Lactuca saligna]|uniref:Uncharacterized protein n=1 Tax=Lactuca saligna TaxID=75948 RepID=A0AA36E6Q1_LACSI|nr:unnamed protein product [Lactuca saligna]